MDPGVLASPSKPSGGLTCLRRNQGELTVGGGAVSEFRTVISRVAAKDLRPWESSTYYAVAEDQEYLDAFWSNGSEFRRLFSFLDLSVVVELGAGHGRNSARMLEEFDVQQVIVTDPIPANIRACSERFRSVAQVSVVQGNGTDLADIPSRSVTAIFSFDSMVHFDMLVVLAYLLETARVLKPGGRALLHHSNYWSNPGGAYGANPHARNFMAPGFVDHVAPRLGLKVISRTTLDWGGHRDLDRLSLLESVDMPMK